MDWCGVTYMSSSAAEVSVHWLIYLLVLAGCAESVDHQPSTDAIDNEDPQVAGSFYFYDPPPNEALSRAKQELAELKALGPGSGPWPGIEPYYYAPSVERYLREPQWSDLHPNSVLPEPRYRSGANWVTEEEFNKTAYAYSVALAEAAVEQAARKESSARDRFEWRREIITNVVEPCLDVAAHYNSPSDDGSKAFKILLRYDNKAEQERLVNETIPKVKDLTKSERAAIYLEMRRNCYVGVR